MQKKVVGILGGMGPLATVDLMEKIIKNTPAAVDQDHLHILVENNPEIPSRVDALLKDGESPVPMLRAGLRQLECWGAQLIAIPCNTAHVFFSDIVQVVQIPVLHLIQETVKAIVDDAPEKVMVLGTKALLDLRIYEDPLREAGVDVVLPAVDEKEVIMEAIYRVKGGEYERARELLHSFLKAISRRGERPPLILGCTELPIIMDNTFLSNIGFLGYDPTRILAAAILREALG